MSNQQGREKRLSGVQVIDRVTRKVAAGTRATPSGVLEWLGGKLLVRCVTRTEKHRDISPVVFLHRNDEDLVYTFKQRDVDKVRL